MNNAYYISLDGAYNPTDIDIGIGSIAYWEFFSFDRLIIARNRKEAWGMFVTELEEGNGMSYMLGDGSEISGQPRPRDLVNVNKWGEGETVRFMQIATDVQDTKGIIPALSNHPLCKVIQHNREISTYARYTYGDSDKPVWFKDGNDENS